MFISLTLCKQPKQTFKEPLMSLLFFVDLVSSREQDVIPGFLNSD